MDIPRLPVSQTQPPRRPQYSLSLSLRKFERYRATTKSDFDFVVSPGDAGLFSSRAENMNSAAATPVVKCEFAESSGQFTAEPGGLQALCAAARSELAESFC